MLSLFQEYVDETVTIMCKSDFEVKVVQFDESIHVFTYHRLIIITNDYISQSLCVCTYT